MKIPRMTVITLGVPDLARPAAFCREMPSTLPDQVPGGGLGPMFCFNERSDLRFET